MPYEVSTPVFEGPFDLLLHLITRQQVDLYEVSLSAIVDAYLAHMGDLQALDLDVATEFLLIAATLIELKTRRLLPDAGDGELDEELALWEERDLLLARLLECKTFKEAARALDRLAVDADRSRPRVAGLEERFVGLVPDVLAGVTPGDLRAAFVRAVTPRPPPRVDLSHVAPVRVSVREVVDELRGVLPAVRHTTFRRLTQGLEARMEVIVRFLALLELYKDGLVDLEQPTSFGELRVRWLGPPGPAAGAVAGTEERA
ncbi:MAG: segregation/condensation protein A, partial [Actinomycetota bacterium]|nr:segregation/condensation protein A [Actinomycetota bacterium]